MGDVKMAKQPEQNSFLVNLVVAPASNRHLCQLGCYAGVRNVIAKVKNFKLL